MVSTMPTISWPAESSRVMASLLASTALEIRAIDASARLAVSDVSRSEVTISSTELAMALLCSSIPAEAPAASVMSDCSAAAKVARCSMAAVSFWAILARSSACSASRAASSAWVATSSSAASSM